MTIWLHNCRLNCQFFYYLLSGWSLFIHLIVGTLMILFLAAQQLPCLLSISLILKMTSFWIFSRRYLCFKLKTYYRFLCSTWGGALEIKVYVLEVDSTLLRLLYIVNIILLSFWYRKDFPQYLYLDFGEMSILVLYVFDMTFLILCFSLNQL